MNPTVLALLLKIKELADRGIAGEREAAQAKLATLLKKYRISLKDLADQAPPAPVAFRYRTVHEKMLGICLCQTVCGRRDVPCRVLPKKTIVLYITKAQEKEWRAIFSHYLAALRKDLSLFLPAFLHRNEIHPPPGLKGAKQLSYEETMALLKMMAYMEKSPYAPARPALGGY